MSKGAAHRHFELDLFFALILAVNSNQPEADFLIDATQQQSVYIRK
jgi:hypothetical protein